MENSPVWFKVLSHFYENNYFQNGLTIPFLLGAASVLDSENEFSNAADFVAQAAGGSLPKKISVQRCAAIGEYVFGIIDNETLKYQYGKAVTKEFGNICITDNSFSDIADIDGLKIMLADKYQELTSAGLFSKNHGNWGMYTETELLRIRETNIR